MQLPKNVQTTGLLTLIGWESEVDLKIVFK